MTSSLVMILVGPLQSWGGPAPGIYERPTEAMPTLSGVVGILANALGRDRADPISDLAAGRLAVRADRPGEPIMDYHTIGAGDRLAPTADGGKGRTVPTERHYLADAAFLAVYTPHSDGPSPAEFLHALNSPAHPLYLGRRGCPPAAPIGVAATDRPAGEIMRTAALLREPPRPGNPLNDTDYYNAQEADHHPGSTTSVVVERSATDTDIARAVMRMDVPATFDPRRLYHKPRYVVRDALTLDAKLCAGRGINALRRLRQSMGAET